MDKKCSHPGCDWSPERDKEDVGVTVAEEILEHKKNEHGGELFPAG